MTRYLFPPMTPPGIAIAGRDTMFPVRRVYCVGRNYAAHAVEMGHDPDREPPFFFQKNPDNLSNTESFPYPPRSAEVHHEVELAVALHSGGTNIPKDKALSHVFGYAIALDMTRRDLQAEAKRAGRPWEIGKSFEHSAPIGPLHPASEVGHLQSGRIRLSVNDAPRQNGDLSQMIWKVPEMISYLSDFFTLAPGDIILTGTPAGVGPISKGDTVRAAIDGMESIKIDVT